MSHTLAMGLGQDGPAVLEWIKSPGKMVDWLKAQMQAFVTLPARIAATRRKAEQLREILKRSGDTTGIGMTEQALAGLSRVGTTHSRLQGSVSDLFGKLGALGIPMPGLSGGQVAVTHGLGFVIPAALIWAGATVALGIAAVFADYRKQAALVDSVAAGHLSPEEAKALGGGRALFGLNLGTLALPLMAIAGFFFLRGAGRRRTMW